MRTLVLIALAVGTRLGAQQAPLTLGEALAIARERSPLVLSASSRRQTVEGRARADAAFPNPIAEWRQENFRSALEPDIFATLQLPIDITGRRLALRKTIGSAMARGRADSAALAFQLDYDVARAFWSAVMSTELLALAAEDRANRGRLADFEAGRFREGAVAEVVAMRTRLELNRARVHEAGAVHDAANARAELARVLGVPVDSLPVVVASADDAAPRDAIPTVDDAMRLAFAQREDLRALRFAVDESAQRARAEQRGLVTDLQFVSGYKKTSGVHSGVLGVALPLPLFSRNEGATMRARGEQALAAAELRDAELRVRGDVHAAVQSLVAVRAAQMDGAASLDAQAEDIAQVAEGAYREGAISLMDLVDAQRTRAESRATAVRWKFDVRMVELDLKRATGSAMTVIP